MVDKESCLGDLQKKSDELSSSMKKAKDEAIKEFKASDLYTKLLDENYAIGFEDFHQDARETFPRVDFDSIRLHIVVQSSLLPDTSQDVDIDDDATTSDKPKDDASTGLSKQSFFLIIFANKFFECDLLFWTIFQFLQVNLLHPQLRT